MSHKQVDDTRIMGPKVTIAIPTYNGSRYLLECLNSAVSQTYKNKEIILIDDCSKDDTVKIASRFNIKIIQNDTRLGMVENWNRCFDYASGEWIKFLHQDDVLEPNCVELMVYHARFYPRKLVACQRGLLFEHYVKDEDRRKWEQFVSRSSLDAYFQYADIGPHEFAAFMSKHPTVNAIGEPSCTMIHRDAVAKLGGFNTKLIQLVDWEYFARIATWKGVVYLNSKLAYYRVHRASATARNVVEQPMLTTWGDPAKIIKELAESKFYKKVRKAAKPHDFASQYKEMTTLHVLR